MIQKIVEVFLFTFVDVAPLAILLEIGFAIFYLDREHLPSNVTVKYHVYVAVNPKVTFLMISSKNPGKFVYDPRYQLNAQFSLSGRGVKLRISQTHFTRPFLAWSFLAKGKNFVVASVAKTT